MNNDVARPTKEEMAEWKEEIKSKNWNVYSPDASKPKQSWERRELRPITEEDVKHILPKAKVIKIKDFRPVSISELVSKEYGEYKYLVDKLIPREGITLISASPKSGKSWFVLYIMLNIARGASVFELATSKSKILFIDEENTQGGLKKRIVKLVGDLSNIDIVFINNCSFKIDEEKDREWLKDYVKANTIDVVVFDSFRRIHSKEENTSDGISEVYDCLKDLMTTGVATVLIDHNRKLSQFEKVSMESIRGSSDKYAMAEAVIMLQTKDLENGKGKRTIVMPVLRESFEVKNFAIEWYDSEESDKVIFEYKGIVEDMQLKKDRAVELIIQIIEEDSQKQTFKTLQVKLKPQGIGDKALRGALSELTLDGRLVETSGTGKQWNTKFYSKSDSLLGSSVYNTAKLPSNSEVSSGYD